VWVQLDQLVPEPTWQDASARAALHISADFLERLRVRGAEPVPTPSNVLIASRLNLVGSTADDRFEFRTDVLREQRARCATDERAVFELSDFRTATRTAHPDTLPDPTHAERKFWRAR
jgi:hypothetical protein